MLHEGHWWQGAPSSAAFSIGAAARHALANAIVFHGTYGCAYANIVVGNVYGPDSNFDAARSYALNAIIKKIVDAKKADDAQVMVWGTGKPVRDWVYIDDLAEAIEISLNIETGTDLINIGSEIGISIARLARMAKSIIGYRGKILFDASRPDGAMRKVLSIAHAKRILHWKPRTSLARGIALTAASFNI